MLQFAFLVILIGALGIGLGVLAWMGFAQRRRRRRLARTAHEMGMMFSPDDPFELTRRYSAFVLAWAGHSPRAENVIYGRHGGWPLRVFDYHFEAGHGPRRLTRRYSVIAAETDLDIPAALLWHAGDTELVPLAVQAPVEKVGEWLVIRGSAVASLLVEAYGSFADEPASLEIHNGCIMLCGADRWKPAELPGRMDRAVAALETLKRKCPPAA